MYITDMRPQASFTFTPWVRGLIIANFIVFFLKMTVFTGPWLLDVFAFQPARVLTRWWTPITYMFLHGGFLHVLFNMLVLFVFGPAVEERMGGRTFGLYYFVCGLGGALLSFGLMLTASSVAVIGASGAVYGVALAYAMFWPDRPILVFPLPMPVKAKWLVIFLVGLSLFSAMFSSGSNVAHLAHLGGFLFGFIFVRVEGSVRNRAREAFTVQPMAHVVPKRRPRPREHAQAAAPGPTPRRDPSVYDEVDRVLDKISESGMDSLTPDERRLLDDVSKRLRSN
jgi:membrane associated rhomboid family serine protease